MLRDLECPKAVLHSLFYDGLRYLLPLKPWIIDKGGAEKKTHRQTDRQTDIVIYRLIRPKGCFFKKSAKSYQMDLQENQQFTPVLKSLHKHASVASDIFHICFEVVFDQKTTKIM